MDVKRPGWTPGRVGTRPMTRVGAASSGQKVAGGSHDMSERDFKANLESATKTDMQRLETGFMQRAKQEQRRFEDATDSEFWFCVCFQSRAQKEAFLKALEWDQFGDKYLNGEAVAEAIDVKLPPGPRFGKVQSAGKLASMPTLGKYEKK